MAAPNDRAVADALDLIDAAVYADVFDTAVSFATLHRFARARVDRDLLASRLRAYPGRRDPFVVVEVFLVIR